MLPTYKINAILGILEHELTTAQGCTEPIAIAYAAALARKTLELEPEQLEIALSGNIIKNARCATVPNTGGLKGMRAAAIAGCVNGDPERKLEVISGLTEADILIVHERMQSGFCTTTRLNSPEQLHIIAKAVHGHHTATVEIAHAHTNVIRIEKDGNVLLDAPLAKQEEQTDALYAQMSFADIIEFANTVPLHRIQPFTEAQLKCNIAICKEGLKRPYGASIGRMLMEGSTDVQTRACAYAAAGSDARMNGCPMPVVINSGSGNQGITVAAPIWVYATHLSVPPETLHRALVLGNLIALYQKRNIGRLSAYCGAVSAACGAGAAITYLHGGTLQQIRDTLSNAIVNLSGMLCDGAKSSCAIKIASSVQAGIWAHQMAMAGNNFLPGDGLVAETVEQTVSNVGYLAHEGLREIDTMMLQQMLEYEARTKF